MSLSDNEKDLFKLLARYASDLMARRICGDLTSEMVACLTKAEWDQLSYDFHLWNSGDPNDDEVNILGADSAVFDFLCEKLLK